MAAEPTLTAVVFAGGLGLGAYHGGAFEALTSVSPHIDWVTGSSAGAITAALIAGCPIPDRLANLRGHWHAPAAPAVTTSPSRHLSAWLSSINTRLLGHTGFFHPRLPLPSFPFTGLYDLGPTRERLQRLIDFGRVNIGELRISICATDLESGDAVLFDSSSEPIEMDHILASCGFLPNSVRCRLPGDGSAMAGFRSTRRSIRSSKLQPRFAFASSTSMHGTATSLTASRPRLSARAISPSAIRPFSAFVTPSKLASFAPSYRAGIATTGSIS
jgi:NTE family protein